MLAVCQYAPLIGSNLNLDCNDLTLIIVCPCSDIGLKIQFNLFLLSFSLYLPQPVALRKRELESESSAGNQNRKVSGLSCVLFLTNLKCENKMLVNIMIDMYYFNLSNV